MNKNQLQELAKELSVVSESLKGSYLLSARLASQDNESHQEQTHLYKVCHERCIKFIETLNELASGLNEGTYIYDGIIEGEAEKVYFPVDVTIDYGEGIVAIVNPNFLGKLSPEQNKAFNEAMKEEAKVMMKEIDEQMIEGLTERFESRKKEIFKVIKGNDEDWLSIIGRRITRILDGGNEIHFYTEGNDTPMMIGKCNVGFERYPCDPTGNENMTYEEYLPSDKDELHTLLLESRDILTELKRCGHFYFSAIELIRYIENPINGEDLEKHIDKLLDAINDKYHQNQS